LERKESKGPQPLSELVRGFLRQHGVQRSTGDERVLEAWTDAAGATWRKRAVPVLFRGGQLTLEVTNSIDLSELKSFRAEDIRLRANRNLGQTLIHKLAFKLRSR